MGNKNLAKAKKVKNDEFYTLYEDVEKEVNYYKNHLENKVVYCNCDNSEESNFWKYFYDNFKTLKLKKIVSTFYTEEGKSYKTEYDGKNIVQTNLLGNGDFRSSESIEILKSCDLVITNPPFSLFRDFVSLMLKHNKDFLIIGPKNAITYKQIFPHIKNNRIRLGKNESKGTMWFKGITGELQSVASYWFTTINNKKIHKWIDLSESYCPVKYPKYDNFDAINVNKVVEIPHDYDGIMGVPITFLAKHNPSQFEIIGEFNHGSDCEYDLAKPSINNKDIFKRIAIRRVSEKVQQVG